MTDPALPCVICVEDPPLAATIEAALQPFAEPRRCTPDALSAAACGDSLLIVDERRLESLPRPLPGALAMGISTGVLVEDVELLARHPWLSQLGTAAVWQGTPETVKWLVYRTSQERPGVGCDTLTFLGDGREKLHAKRVLFYRSQDIEPRLARLEAFAASVGARPRAIEQLHDIANEMLINALYDAPYEAGLVSAPPPRSQPIELPPDLPCEMVYGAIDNEIFVRVRDCFGALTQARLIEVLLRCARGANAVTLDESRGGAGLGMWRIFRQSNRVVVSVAPGASTEMLVTVPKTGVLKKNHRSWHFLFEASRTQ